MSDPRLELQTYAYGFMITQAIAAMARGGIADAVSERPRTVPELAAAAGLHEDAFTRVLRALAALGIFRLDEDGFVSNTPRSEYLRSDVDGSVRWIVQSFAGEHYRVWGHSAESFAHGRGVAERALGAQYFEWLAQHPAEAETFNKAMAASSSLRFEALAERDWSSELVVDVGGGTGALLASLLSRHNGLRGIVFDLPHIAASAQARFAAAGIADRCAFVSGDFFAEVPAGGDVYVLSQILHDWDDEPATRILRACRVAAKPSSRLLLLERVLPEGEGAHLDKLLDLHMLVLLGGCERTEAEWRALLHGGGFEWERAEVAGAFPVIEARPLASPAGPD